ncbi:MAG: outer membrane lipoprotein-sorting protein [Desulfuromonadales bacterium]|nr:outer membrane lipoprotein-sorting protein [Desulfuromonadales bacterium]
MVRPVMPTIVHACWIVLLLLAAHAMAADMPKVEDVVRRLDDLYRTSASSGHVELIAKTETQTRHLKMRIWSKGKDRSLIIIDEPVREAGTETLKVGNNLWNYLPKISRTIRIPPSMMLSSWMGTDFTNDDLVKDSSYERDFDTRIMGRSLDPKGWIGVMEVRPGVVGRWRKIEWVVNEDASLPLMARFFDRKGRLARTMRFSDVRMMGGRRIPTRVQLETVDQPGHLTELRYLDMKFDLNLPDSLFSLSQLERQ